MFVPLASKGHMSHICRTSTMCDSRVGLKLWRLFAKGATRRGPSKRQPSPKGRAVMAGRGTASKATAKSLGIPPSSGAREAKGGSEGHTVESGARKSGVEGKRVAGRQDLGGRRSL